MAKFKGAYHPKLQEKRKKRIVRSSSLEEFSSSLQLSAGLLPAIRSKDKTALESLSNAQITPEGHQLANEEFISFIVTEILQLLEEARIFFSEEPEKAVEELRDLLTSEEIVSELIAALSTARAEEDSHLEAVRAIEEYNAEIEAGETPDPKKYEKYRLRDEE